MEHLTLLIKPAAGLCNLRCKYCFYRDLTGHEQMQCMSTETAEHLICRAMEAAEKSVTFLFQGGEPTLAGLEFFRAFTACVAQQKPAALRVYYGIQTNGMLLDDAWVQFLAEHRFLVGLSLDGNAALHDKNRVDAGGSGTFRSVMQAAKRLERAKVPFNVLSVVTGATARHARQLFQWYQGQNFRYLQFIPCLDPIEKEPGHEPYSLTPERYGKFLQELFSCYYAGWKSGNYVSIQLFDDYVHLLAGQAAGTCASSGQCGRYLVVEHDGSCYPCDFYVLPEWKLGRIQTQRIEELQGSAIFQRFLQQKKPMETCKTCPYASLCRGGCKRHCQYPAGLGENYFCTAFQHFFSAAMPALLEMAAAERAAASARRGNS